MFSKGRGKGTIRFSIKPSQKASQVHVAGEFSQWQPVEMRKGRGGMFAATVKAAPVTEYKFIVDGQWLTDPDHASWSVNSFGTLNSVARLQA